MSEKPEPKIFYFTNIPSVYRTRLWQTLLESTNFKIFFGFGLNNNLGIKSIDFSAPFFQGKRERLFQLKNIWLRKKYMPWQVGVLRKCLFNKPKAVVFMGDATVLTYWLGALICRIKGIKVIFHTHGYYGDETGLKLAFRKSFYRLANNFLSYERRGKKLMVERGVPAERIHVFYNSLDYPKHLSLRKELQKEDKDYEFDFFENPKNRTLIFIGRLTFEKKLHLLIEVVKELKEKHSFNLLIIGGGEAQGQLKGLIDEESKKYIHLYGPCYDEKLIAEMLFNSYLCVSPGNVGLTAIHSMSFGTPVCTHSNFNNQGPEVEAINQSVTGFLFEENDLEDLKNKIEHWANLHKTKSDEIRTHCYEIIDNYYNPYYQEKVLANLINGGNPLDTI